jgi:hypothetical protein
MDPARFKELFGDRSAAYFFLKFRNFKHRSKSTIDDSLFYRALIYIGIAASVIEFNEKSAREKAELLYKEFIERHRAEIQHEQSTHSKKVNKYFGREAINPIKEVEALIKTFFDLIINGQEDKTSELMTDIETTSEQTVRLFTYIIKINSLVVSQFKRPSHHMIECNVYIDSEIAQITTKETLQPWNRVYQCCCKLEDGEWRIQRMVYHRMTLPRKYFGLMVSKRTHVA